MPHSTSQYITTSNSATSSDYISIESLISKIEKKKNEISPQLYFKYTKKKFGTFQGITLERRLKRLRAAFDKVVSNGQEDLGMKLMREIDREVRESMMYARGVKHFIEKEDADRFRTSLAKGKISDTKFESFTRVIPKDVLEKKKKVQDLFDGFVIYHYWNEDVEKDRGKKQKMDESEKQKMRDPILFGVIKESNRLYFVADWEDEYCDLTFDQMIDLLGKDEDEVRIDANPKLNV